ncbi:MAG: hypothetical protein L0229_20255 [Blastocatellia bacterium]|nr:hypothetical protein [Blastocatellia bacterium]
MTEETIQETITIWLDAPTIDGLRAALPEGLTESAKPGDVIPVALEREHAQTAMWALELKLRYNEEEASEPQAKPKRPDAAEQALRRQKGEVLPR